VKKTFLRLALESHPDVATSNSSSIRTSASVGHLSSEDAQQWKKRQIENFLRYRSAYESIVELADGSASIRQSCAEGDYVSSHEKDYSTDQEFQSWFYAQSKYAGSHDEGNLALDPKTLREVADVADNMAQGGLDRGGMWAFAATVRDGLKRKHGRADTDEALPISSGVTTNDADGRVTTSKIGRRTRWPASR